MVNVNAKEDLTSLISVFETLKSILANPTKYSVVNFEAEQGTSRSEVPGSENLDHAMQRIGISVIYVQPNSD